MKRIIGFFIIILAIPTVYIIQIEIVSEFNEVSSFTNQITNSIEITAPIHDIPLVMKDRNGVIFSEEYVEWRNPLTLSEIPPIVQEIFIDSEDNEFHNHRGYNIAAITRALLINSKTDDLQQGGSTITQQLVRMRFLSTEKTYERKITELFYAAELEKQASKDEILEMYLNEMYFGNLVYGIGAAATYYFSRPVGDLNIAEIAFISAIPNNPSLYNPFINFDLTKKRQERLLDTLVKSDRMTSEEANLQKKAPIQLSVKSKSKRFPAYKNYVLNELEELIADSEGFSKRIDGSKDEGSKVAILAEVKKRTADILASGIVIETALDSDKQEKDELEISSLLQPENLQAGAVVIDNSTREIISLYGGKEYKKANFNRAYQAVRQPGSAIKPLLVYAPLFESGSYTENTPVNSGPICIGTYCPKNIGEYVYGITSIQDAFRHSHNTTAIRLFQMNGIEESFDFLKPFKFNSISPKDMNYPAALGGFTNGVTPLELADAFTGFIDGTYTPAHAIRTVKDQEGNVLYEWEDSRIDVWSPSTVKLMRDLLEDVVLSGTGRGVPHTTTYTGAKTGTTDDYKDLWTAGLNDYYTTAVWIGYDNPQSMRQMSHQKMHLKAFSLLLK